MVVPDAAVAPGLECAFGRPAPASDGDAELEDGERHAGHGGAAAGPGCREGDESVPRQRLDIGVDVLEGIVSGIHPGDWEEDASLTLCAEAR